MSGLIKRRAELAGEAQGIPPAEGLEQPGSNIPGSFLSRRADSLRLAAAARFATRRHGSHLRQLHARPINVTPQSCWRPVRGQARGGHFNERPGSPDYQAPRQCDLKPIPVKVARSLHA